MHALSIKFIEALFTYRNADFYTYKAEQPTKRTFNKQHKFINKQ